MPWDWRTLAALVIGAASPASLLACTGAEFSSSAGGDGGSSQTGGKPTNTGGKSSGGSGTSQGGKGGGAGSPTAGAAPIGGQINTSGAGGSGPLGGSGGAGGGSEPPFEAPGDGLLFWFSSDFGVESDNGGVLTWKNRATSGFNASQPVVELRPTLTPTEQVPLPLVAFDGVDDYMELPEVAPAWEAGLSLFVVAGSSATVSCSAFIELSNGAEINDINFGAHGDAIQYEIDQSVLTGESGTFPAGDLRLVAAHHSAGPEQTPVELRVNGGQAGSTVMPLPPNVPRISNFLGRTLYDSCVVFSGGIAELLLYTRKVSSDERASIEVYLRDKWQCCQ